MSSHFQWCPAKFSQQSLIAGVDISPSASNSGLPLERFKSITQSFIYGIIDDMGILDPGTYIRCVYILEAVSRICALEFANESYQF